MNTNLYKKAFAKIEVNEKCIEGVVDMAMMNNRKSKKIKFKWVVPCVVTVAMMSGITAAAYGLGFVDTFKIYFENNGDKSSSLSDKQISDVKTSSLSDKQLAQIDKASVGLVAADTDNGATFNLKAAVGDSSNAYILLDVIGPEGTVLNGGNGDSYNFEEQSIDFKPTINSSSNAENEQTVDENGYIRGGSCGSSLNPIKDDNLADNKKSFMLKINTTNINLQNVDVILSFKNLLNTTGDKPETILSGNWNFEFKLAYDTQTKEFEVNKLSNYNGVNSSVTKVGISSLSASVTFEGGASADSKYTVMGQDPLFNVPHLLLVNFKDGTSTAFDDNGSGMNILTNGVQSGVFQQYIFDAPIDLSTVKSITLGDLEIPIE